MKENNNHIVKLLMLWAVSGLVYADEDLLLFHPINHSQVTNLSKAGSTNGQANTPGATLAVASDPLKSSAEAHQPPQRKSSAAHSDIIHPNKQAQLKGDEWKPRKRLNSSGANGLPSSHAANAKTATVGLTKVIANQNKANQPSTTKAKAQTQKTTEKNQQSISHPRENTLPPQATPPIVEKRTDGSPRVSEPKQGETKTSRSTFINQPAAFDEKSSETPQVSTIERRSEVAKSQSFNEVQPRSQDTTVAVVANIHHAPAKPTISKALSTVTSPHAKKTAPIALATAANQVTPVEPAENSFIKPETSFDDLLTRAEMVATTVSPPYSTPVAPTVKPVILKQKTQEESQSSKQMLPTSMASILENAKAEQVATPRAASTVHQSYSPCHKAKVKTNKPLRSSTVAHPPSQTKPSLSSLNAGEKLKQTVIIAGPETMAIASSGLGADSNSILHNLKNESDKPHPEQIIITKYATNTRDFLRQVIQEAMNYSPEIKGQQANSIAAEYDTDQAKGQRWPQISVGAATPTKSVGSGNRNSSSSLSDSFATVNATTNIYDFGMTNAKIDAAENTQKSSSYMLTMTRNQIAGQLLKQILQLRQYQEQLEVAKKFHLRMSKLTDMMSQIVDKDPGRGSELVQARAKLLEADTHIRNTEHSLENTQIAIMRLIGHRLNLPVGLDFTHIDMSKTQIQKALKVHPKLLADKEDYEAAKNRTKAANAVKYPRINWIVSKSTEKDEDGHQDAWQTGVQLQWDVFSGGSTVASVKAAASRASASKMQLDTDYLEIENQIDNLLFQKTSSQVRSKDYQKLIKETDKVSQMFYQQWYYLGKRSLLDVLTSETDHFNQQLSEIQIRYEGYQASTGLLVQTVNLLPWTGLRL